MVDMNFKKLGLALIFFSFCIFCLFYVWSKQLKLVSQLRDSSSSDQVGTTVSSPKPTLTEDQKNAFIANKEKKYLLEDIISVTENNNTTIVNVSGIANGMYLLSVEQNGFTLNKQVVIAK